MCHGSINQCPYSSENLESRNTWNYKVMIVTWVVTDRRINYLIYWKRSEMWHIHLNKCCIKKEFENRWLFTYLISIIFASTFFKPLVWASFWIVFVSFLFLLFCPLSFSRCLASCLLLVMVGCFWLVGLSIARAFFRIEMGKGKMCRSLWHFFTSIWAFIIGGFGKCPQFYFIGNYWGYIACA